MSDETHYWQDGGAEELAKLEPFSEQVWIGCACGDEDCHYKAAGQPWCAPCERHVRLEELTDDGKCPRHPTLEQHSGGEGAQ